MIDKLMKKYGYEKTDENGEAWEFYPEEIGKTVFLNREEAEKALEAMKK